jgi:Spy/CpxP family protein refolding chaperone
MQETAGKNPPANPDHGGGSGGGGARIPRELETALAKLNLTGDQKQKVDAAVQDFQDKQRQLREALLQNLKTDLNADQYAQVENAFQKQPGQRPDRPPEGNPSAGGGEGSGQNPNP